MTFKNFFLLGIFLLTFMINGKTQSLEEHLWKDRIILLFASDFQNEVLQTQLKILNKEKKGLQERKLVIYQITPDAVKIDDKFLKNKKWNSTIHRQFKINNSPDKQNNNIFTFILIGLDGGEKLRHNSIVNSSELFGKIDRMPMRRAEIRKSKS